MCLTGLSSPYLFSDHFSSLLASLSYPFLSFLSFFRPPLIFSSEWGWHSRRTLGQTLESNSTDKYVLLSTSLLWFHCFWFFVWQSVIMSAYDYSDFSLPPSCCIHYNIFHLRFSLHSPLPFIFTPPPLFNRDCRWWVSCQPSCATRNYSRETRPIE